MRDIAWDEDCIAGRHVPAIVAEGHDRFALGNVVQLWARVRARLQARAARLACCISGSDVVSRGVRGRDQCLPGGATKTRVWREGLDRLRIAFFFGNDSRLVVMDAGG